MYSQKAFTQLQQTIKALYDGQAWVDCTSDTNGNPMTMWVGSRTWETMMAACETLVKVYEAVIVDVTWRKGVYCAATFTL